jgi:hypothetical protein
MNNDPEVLPSEESLDDWQGFVLWQRHSAIIAGAGRYIPLPARR